MSVDDFPDIDTKCNEEEITKRTTFEPDNRLQNWEKWMRKRRSIHENLKKKTGRVPAEFLINTSEDRKQYDEYRRIIEYSRIPSPWDRYRGNPSDYTVPPMLYKTCYDDWKEYRVTLTLPEKCLVPDIEYVKVPDAIKEEKEVICTRNLYDLNKSNYCKLKLKEPRILELLPHRPELANIVVIGKTIQNIIENNTVDKILTTSSGRETPEHTKKVDYLLSLNDLQLFPNDSGVRSVKLFLEATINCVEFLYLSIHNNSKKSIRFNFHKYSTKRVLGQTLKQNYDEVFYWNKNVHVLQPDEKINFPICFKSEVSGPYNLTLRITLKPDFWDTSLTILALFQVNITNKNFESWCRAVTRRLDRQIRAAIISETLDNLLQPIPRKKSDVVIYTYDKPAIFESINAIYGPSNFCLKYVYDKNVVDELESFYDAVRLEKHSEVWDYRIETLRTVTKHRENYDIAMKLQEDLENLREKIEKCKEEREKLDERVKLFWIEKSEDKKGKGKDTTKTSKKADSAKKKKPDKAKHKEKKSSDKGKKKKIEETKIVEPIRPPLPKTLSDNLEAIINKLSSPTTWKIEHSKRIQLCYTLFCAYIDKICEESSELEFMFGLTKTKPRVVDTLYIEKNRIYDEELDVSSMQYPRMVDMIINLSDVPAPPWSLAIPLENYEERFAAFRAEKSSPNLRATVNSRVSRVAPKSVEKEENENLYEDEEEEEEEIIPTEIYEHYQNNLYIIFNRNLWALVDDLIGVFEFIPKPQVKLETVREIQLQLQEDLGVDEDEIRVFDLKKTIFDLLKESGQEPRESAECICECVCELNQSVLDIFTTYQTRPCGMSRDSETEAGMIVPTIKEHVAVGTSPSIDVPPVVLYDGEGLAGQTRKSISEECICKIKTINDTFKYYDSRIGFDVEKPIANSDDLSSND